MKKLASLLVVAAVMATGSQAFGQKVSSGNGELVPNRWLIADRAYDASLAAYYAADDQTNYWNSLSFTHPNGSAAASYWRTSRNYQYWAVIRIYYICRDIDNGIPVDRWELNEAMSCSGWAGMYAVAAGGLVGQPNHLAVQAARASCDAVLDLEGVAIVLPDMIVQPDM